MSVCVCGCPEAVHREITMSVQLTRDPMKPPVVLSTVLPPYNTFPTSTYVRDDCTVCGCGQFIEDTGVAVAAVG